MEQLFIDHFIVPQAAKTEFTERMAINRNMIKKLPGFIRDEVFVREDEEGQLQCITIAVSESEAALKSAKANVQAEYQRQGFNLSCYARTDGHPNGTRTVSQTGRLEKLSEIAKRSFYGRLNLHPAAYRQSQ